MLQTARWLEESRAQEVLQDACFTAKAPQRRSDPSRNYDYILVVCLFVEGQAHLFHRRYQAGRQLAGLRTRLIVLDIPR